MADINKCFRMFLEGKTPQDCAKLKVASQPVAYKYYRAWMLTEIVKQAQIAMLSGIYKQKGYLEIPDLREIIRKLTNGNRPILKPTPENVSSADKT